MHFRILVPVYVALPEQAPVTDKDLAAAVKAEQFAFALRVKDEFISVLDPYARDSENPAYEEFCDLTDQAKEQYENGMYDCVQLPSGKIDFASKVKYVERNGKLYNCHWIRAVTIGKRRFGPWVIRRRVRKLKFLPKYPMKKLFSSWQEYAEGTGLQCDEETGRYGFRWNAAWFFDTAVIGGRWKRAFLVPEGCMNCIPEDTPAPEGYKWACAARKADVAWDVMRELYKKEMREEYNDLKTRYETKTPPEGNGFRITEDGISCCGKLIYVNGQSEAEFRALCYHPDEEKYPLTIRGYMDGGYVEDETWNEGAATIEEAAKRAENNRAWSRQVDEFIERLPDDAILVSGDCHN